MPNPKDFFPFMVVVSSGIKISVSKELAQLKDKVKKLKIKNIKE